MLERIAVASVWRWACSVAVPDIYRCHLFVDKVTAGTVGPCAVGWANRSGAVVWGIFREVVTWQRYWCAFGARKRQSERLREYPQNLPNRSRSEAELPASMTRRFQWIASVPSTSLSSTYGHAPTVHQRVRALLGSWAMHARMEVCFIHGVVLTTINI